MLRAMVGFALGLGALVPAAAADYDLAPVKAKIDVAAVQIVVKEDPFGHRKQSACGRYVVYTPAGARVGLEQFVFTGGELVREGDAHFSSVWERNCSQW